ncbi:MAG TPA: translation elongation factor Ts [Tepidisphaeraceae bacterium]|nr:translation elongation factor Ts [Tepidisphaeraceae bacterium]
MSQISARAVNELRNRTGQGMMECKKMLTESGGDIEKAIEGFRKKGVKASILERAATEGRIVGAVAPSGKIAALVEVNCNTDFTAKSEPILALARNAANALLADSAKDVKADPSLTAAAAEVARQTGENVQIGRTAVLSNSAGKVGLYLYETAGKGKIGVLVSVSGDASQELINDLGMHIAAARPLALDRNGIPADVVAKEREIAIEQAKATGKPQQIAEKIAEGKMRTFYEEKALLDQPFINAEKFKGSVAAMLKGKGVTLNEYVRLEVGQ